MLGGDLAALCTAHHRGLVLGFCRALRSRPLGGFCGWYLGQPLGLHGPGRLRCRTSVFAASAIVFLFLDSGVQRQAFALQALHAAGHPWLESAGGHRLGVRLGAGLNKVLGGKWLASV